MKRTFLKLFYASIFLYAPSVSAQSIGINNTNPQSTLDVTGSFGNNIRVVSSTSSLLSTDATVLAGAGITLTLPASVGTNRRVILIAYNASYGGAAVTIKPTGADNIISNNITYASASGILLTIGSVAFQSDGSGNWYATMNNGAQAGNSWLLIGNSGTVAGTNFLGTTDAVDFVIKSSSVERIRLTSAGNVGIGTSSPTNLLSLDGQAARTIWMERNTTAATAGNSLTLQSGGAYNGGTNLSGGDLNLSSGTSTGTGISNIYLKTSTAGSSGTSDNAPSTKVTVTGSGNMGIGTTSPTNMLSLSGQAARTIWMERNTTSATAGNGLTVQSGGAFSGGTNLSGGSLMLSAGTSTGTGSSNIYFNTAPAGSSGTTDNNPTTKVTILGNGMVGAGTGSPIANLHFYGLTQSGFTPAYPSGITVSQGPEIAFSHGSFTKPGASIQMMDYDGYSSGFSFNVHKGINNGGNGSNADNWPTDVVQAVTIDNMGHVGIGTAAPTSYLQVNGSVSLPTASVNAATTLDAGDYMTIMTGTSAVITLPAASGCSGRIYVLVNQTASGRTISAYINFSNASTTTVGANSSITIQSNGSNWIRIQ